MQEKVWAAKAIKRMRNGKPPYPIHRTQARHSLFQHEQAMELLAGVSNVAAFKAAASAGVGS